MKMVIGVVLMVLAGCTVVRQRDSGLRKEPTTWVLVSRPYADVTHLAVAGVARVSNDVTGFFLEPLQADDRTSCPHALRILDARRDSMVAGEIAEATIAIDDADRHEHILELVPTDVDVVLLTPARVTLGPGTSTRVRFTRSSEGRGGVTVRVVNCRLVD